MLIRYRRLAGRIDPRAVAEVLRDEARHGGGAFGGTFALASAAASTPREVMADERQAPLHEVRSLLRQGALQPTDLVDVGEGWTTFDDCPVFDDDCEPFRQRRRRLSALAIAGIILAAVAGVALLFVWQAAASLG